MEVKNSRLERGVTKIISPVKTGELISIYPGKGPNTYKKVGQDILSVGQELQTGYETSAFLKSTYKINEPETKDVRGKMITNRVWIYQTTFWLPQKQKNSGMYSVYDSKALGRKMKFNQDEFEEALKDAEIYQGVRSNPETGVAFAPIKTIYLGKEGDWDKFAINGLNIALFSPKGAENMAEIGKNNFPCGCTSGITENNNVESRVSAVDGGRFFVRGLYVDGDDWDDSVNGHSWGKLRK